MRELAVGDWVVMQTVLNTDGLPCGACLIGPAGTDHALIALAAQLAEVH